MYSHSKQPALLKKIATNEDHYFDLYSLQKVEHYITVTSCDTHPATNYYMQTINFDADRQICSNHGNSVPVAMATVLVLPQLRI